jgi:hypothetical protein
VSPLTRGWKVVVLVAVGAIAGGGAFAVASVPDSNGLVHLCYVVTKSPTSGEPVPATTAPNVTVIDPSAGQSCSEIKVGGADSEQPLTIDQTGVQGPTGPSGTPGTQGPAGLQGTAGPQIALPTTNSAVVGQVTLRPPVQGKAGGKAPASITFNALSVTLNDKSKHGSLTIVKQDDSSITQLLQALGTDRVFPSVTISLDGANGKPAVHYTLKNAVIEQSEITGAGDVRTQSLTLEYQAIVVQQ